MSNVRRSGRSNFVPRPQDRLQGSGAGRSMFPWKKKYGWLVIAAEQICVREAGSEGALLEDRKWVRTWGLTPNRLKLEVERLFPGINLHILQQWDGATPWQKNLHNRIYKMYYSGSSDRGYNHNPLSRPSISTEHWRHWDTRQVWEEEVLSIVASGRVCRTWRNWL